MNKVPWFSPNQILRKNFFMNSTKFIDIPEEFYAILKKGPLLQKNHECFVYCMHIVPNEIGKDRGYASFPASLCEASYIESEYPEFASTGIQGKWKFKGTLQLIQHVKDIKLCKEKDNFFSKEYVKYF